MRQQFPIGERTEALAALRDVLVDLPRLTARYEGQFEAAAAAVFRAEGLGIRDFKARILKRAYLTKGERQVAFVPDDVGVGTPEADDLNDARWRVTVNFSLDTGRYATLVLKNAAALVGERIRVR
jgi:tRNA(Glu) U13 pseudouridine synthase TruD